jgi:hypothetical protein
MNLMVTSDFINPVTTLNAVPGDPELRGSIPCVGLRAAHDRANGEHSGCDRARWTSS